MDVPKDIEKQVEKNEIDFAVSKYEHLDYSSQHNYEKLCSAYRDAKYANNIQLADALYAIMRKAQIARSKNSSHKILVPTRVKEKHRETTPKSNKHITKKQELLDEAPEKVPHVFSFANSLAYFGQHRKAHQAFRATEFAQYFNIDLVFANNILDLATKMTILNATIDGKYYRKKRKKIDYNKAKKFKSLSDGQVRNLLTELIEKTGPIEYVPEYKPPVKKRKVRIITPGTGKNDKTRHFGGRKEESYSLKIEGNAVDSMHEIGHGRKKSQEYTKDIAVQNSRNRYGLKGEKPILDYDLD